MFVHFLHDQLLKLATSGQVSGSRREIGAVRAGLRWATFLTRDPLFIPTVDLAQSPVAEALAADLALLAREDFVQFIGSSVDLDDIYRSKRTHFNRTSLLAPWEDREARDRLQRFENSLEARGINTTADLKMRWMRGVGNFILLEDDVQGTPLSRQIRHVGVMLNRSSNDRKLSDALGQIPKRLEKHAFLWQVVEDLRIFPFRTAGQPRRQLEIGLAWEWIMSHLDEYRTTLLIRLPGLGAMEFGVGETNPSSIVDLSKYQEAMALLRLDSAFESLTLSEIVALRYDPKALGFRDGYLRRLYSLLQSPEPGPESVRIYNICERIRTSVIERRTPLKAIEVASELAQYLDEPGPENRTVSHNRASSVGVFVALAEELETLKAVAERRFGPLEVEHNAQSGRTVFRVPQYTTTKGRRIDLFFALVGKGQEEAAAATALILSENRVDVAVNIGIAGGLSNDASLADVAVGTEVVSYMDNSKAEAGANGEVEFKFASKTVVCDAYLNERIQELRLGSRKLYEELRNELLVQAQKLVADTEVLDAIKCNILLGPIATGPTVAAASGFKEWVLNFRRDLVAIDMEASGVGIAVGGAGMVRRIRFLALRGISDLADESKKKLEGDTKGAVRELATVAPMAVLLAMLDELPQDVLLTGD